jgi:cytochrome c peroxidase
MKLTIVYLLLINLLLIVVPACSDATITPSTAIHQSVAQDIDTLQTFIEHTLLPLAQKGTSADSLQKAFLEGRRQYKKIEYLTEYFMPATTRLVNGPPLPEVEMEENTIFEPGGFQVIEEYLFPEPDTAQQSAMLQEIARLHREIKRYALLWNATTLTDSYICDAMRLQAFRIITLGITGFDTPLSKRSLEESAMSLQTMQRHLKYYTSLTQNRPAFDILQHQLAAAAGYLRRHPDFDSFDRMHFITQFVNPLTVSLWRWQKAEQIPFVTDIRPFRADAKTLFDEAGFDPNFYTNFPEQHLTPEKIALGQRLFFDPILSANNQRSCASCHQPDKAFTDGLAKSENIHKTGFVKRNTPTLLNVALQRGQFYDFRMATLESQVQEVIESKDEMHSSLPEACRKLQKDASYVALFQQAFPEMKDTISPVFLQNALSSYERSLLSFQSRFDLYIRGDYTQLNVQEIKGFNLFMGKAKCGSCHFMPLFNGTVPPNFTKTESEVIGIPATKAAQAIDPDMGRYAVNPLTPWKHAFKTTTVRNAGLTAPYMHNGIYTTLDEVIDFYNKGGGVGLGIGLPNQTLPFDHLNLTKDEKKALVAFIHALSDNSVAKPMTTLAHK